jgi:pyruvate dehydrogenase E1 component alpha subunit
MKSIDKTEVLGLFREMLRIRLIEEALADRYAEQEMRCPMHLCIGQEAIAVGVCAAMKHDDVVYGNHRAHGHYLAKGGSLNAMVAELYGKSTGCCGGRGGSMHLIDLEAGFLGSTPIVGGTIPLAVGAAWAAKLKGEARVCTVFFGDGCFEEGVIHESMNFAMLHHLPIIFVCENNDFSVYTRLNERQPERPIHKVAQAHGLTTYVGDGNDVDAVYEMTQTAIKCARDGKGPQFMEFSVYRWREHCGPSYDDELNYRTQNEIEDGVNSCPIKRYEGKLNELLPSFAAEYSQFKTEIGIEIEAAFKFSLNSPIPTIEDARERIYA